MTGEPYFSYFVDYYGSNNCDHRLVEAAFAGLSIGFDNGDTNFLPYGILGKIQVIKEGTVYMYLLM